jgi:hypothetical protein
MNNADGLRVNKRLGANSPVGESSPVSGPSASPSNETTLATKERKMDNSNTVLT